MYARLTTGIKGFGMRGLAAALLFVGAPFAMAQDAQAPSDSLLDGWLGKEFTVDNPDILWLYNSSPEGMSDLISILKSAGQKPKN